MGNIRKVVWGSQGEFYTFIIAVPGFHYMLKVFQDATLEFSQTNVPTISKVLPLFKMIQQHLLWALKEPDLAKDRSGMMYQGLKTALKCGLEKIEAYLEKALVSDYMLLGASGYYNYLPHY